MSDWTRKMRRGWLLCGLASCLAFSALPAAAQNDSQGAGEPTQESANNTQTESQSTAQAPEAAYVHVPATLTLKAGTVIAARVSQWLSSDKNKPGNSFSAELVQPVVVNGWVVARRGQTVMGRVVVAKKAGRIKGTSQLGVELSELVLVDGQQLPIHSQLLRHSGRTSKGRDTQTAATTTGIGAVIGGAASGGEGAGIGAAIGAGAGLAGILLTRGRATEIAPETALTFQLQDAVTITTANSGPAFRRVQPEDYNTETLERRPQRFSSDRNPPSPPPYYDYYGPWGFYPGPMFVGFYGFGGRWGHHRGRW